MMLSFQWQFFLERVVIEQSSQFDPAMLLYTQVKNVFCLFCVPHFVTSAKYGTKRQIYTSYIPNETRLLVPV